LIGQPNAFGVGSQTTACTQGLWLWNQVMPVKTKDGQIINVLFVDTEGLGDTEKETNNDVRIFMFAMLMSSHLIYNCTGVIDSNMIQQLSLVTKMSDRIRLSNA
jgi:hypothetical protein